MAIITLQNTRADAEPFDCFYCGRPVTTGGPVVVWHGATTTIELHSECVVELGIRLFVDVHKVECTTGHYMTARTLPELRARLMEEEHRP